MSIIFALSLLPVLGLSAAALDYGRAVQTRAKLQSSMDAAVLAAARDSSSLSDAQLTARAHNFITANLHATTGGFTLDSVNVSRAGKVIRVASQATVPTAMLGIIGINSITVGGEAQSTWGDFNIEIALVLDNTGSMASSNKLQELKRALCGDMTCSNPSPSTGFMKIMKDAAGSAGRVKVGIVPFDTTARMPQSVQNAVNTGIITSTNFYAPATSGYCTNAAVNDQAQRVSWFRFANRDKDTRAGNMIGGINVGNGCGTSGQARATPANWEGCVWDRDVTTSRDATDGNIDLNDTASLHPAVNCRSNNLARIRPLADVWTDSGNMISHLATMQPSGNTNLTVGVSWGQALLTNAAPFTEAAPSSTSSLYRVMILLTDGDNTESKHTSSQSNMDNRARAACTSTKAQGITIYSVRVIDGNAGLLRDCATNPGNYYEVSSAAQLTPVFQAIAAQIGSIRITN
ncbi:MAG: pilus assembly protein TadG-related protein [Bosea sp. (in: a-proteobacteria)]